MGVYQQGHIEQAVKRWALLKYINFALMKQQVNNPNNVPSPKNNNITGVFLKANGFQTFLLPNG